MKRIYRKSILSLLTIPFVIHCYPALSGATTTSGNEYFDMDIAQLMQLTITSVTKQPQNLSAAAAAVFVITQDDINRSGVTSIPEALRMVPGLQVARIDSNKWAITSRGFNGQFANKLLVLIDGRTVYAPSFSGVYWDSQDTLLDDIDRIEVVRGPGATIWGSNAVNGIINIITKKASDTQGGLVSLGSGTHDQVMGGLRYGTAIGDSAHGRAYLTYHKQDSFELEATGEDANDDWGSLRTGFRLDGVQGNYDSWTLQGDLYSNKENQILSPFWHLEYPFVSVKYDDFETSGWNILGRWQKKLSDTSSWNIQTYYDYTDRDEAILTQTHKTFDLELQYQAQFGKHNSMIMGLGYRSINADFEYSFQVKNSSEETSEELSVYSGFIQDEIMLISDKLWLTLGAKWEHNDFTGHEIQPSGRLLYKVTDKQTAWAAVSRAVRTPSELENGSSITVAVDPTFPTGPIVFSITSNSEFDSEELIAYEAGYRWQPMTNFALDLAVFYNDYESLMITDFTSFNELTFLNGMQGSTHGVELTADWQPLDRIKFQLGYTYIGFNLEADSSSFSSDLGNATEGISPEHQASLRSAININEDLQLNLWGRYVGALDSSITFFDAKVPVDDYLTLDANVSWQPIKKLELQLVGQNLLNSSHMEYKSEFNTPATEVERSVYGKVTYHF